MGILDKLLGKEKKKEEREKERASKGKNALKKLEELLCTDEYKRWDSLALDYYLSGKLTKERKKSKKISPPTSTLFCNVCGARIERNDGYLIPGYPSEKPVLECEVCFRESPHTHSRGPLRWDRFACSPCGRQVTEILISTGVTSARPMPSPASSFSLTGNNNYSRKSIIYCFIPSLS